MCFKVTIEAYPCGIIGILCPYLIDIPCRDDICDDLTPVKFMVGGVEGLKEYEVLLKNHGCEKEELNPKDIAALLGMVLHH